MSENNRLKPIDITILLPVMVLVLIGIIMIYSASFVQSKALTGDELYFLRGQLMYGAVGVVAMMIASVFPYRFYHIFSKIIFILNFLLLVLTLYGPFSVTTNEATRWIKIGFSFQTSEFSKFANIVVVSSFILKNEKNMHELKTIIKGLILIMVPVLLILKQPSYSAAATIAITGFAMLFIAGMRAFHTMLLGGMGVVGGAALIAIAPYRVKRFMTFLNPFADVSGDGWQVVNSIYAIAQGGLNGVGYGKGVQKYFYLSQPQNDFIFATIAEELGLFRSFGILLIYVYLVFRIFYLFENLNEVFPQFIVAGIGIQIGIQTVMNVAVATSMMPNTGMGLPFVSYGGTSLIVFLAMIGVVLNISKYRRLPKNKNKRKK